MRKIIILIPVFNDWESLKRLLQEINENIKTYKNINFECLIINDASTINQSELIKPSHIKSLEILNMRENRGQLLPKELKDLKVFFFNYYIKFIN